MRPRDGLDDDFGSELRFQLVGLDQAEYVVALLCERDLLQERLETLFEMLGEGIFKRRARKAQYPHGVERRRAGDSAFLLGQVEQPVVGLAQDAAKGCLEVREAPLSQRIEELRIVLVHPATLDWIVLRRHGNSRGG